jgi:hypothetical protein
MKNVYEVTGIKLEFIKVCCITTFHVAIPLLQHSLFKKNPGERREFRLAHPTALGYGLDDRSSRVRFPAGARNLSFTTASRTALEPTQPPIQWVPGDLSLGVKRPLREADHSPPSRAEVQECVELYFHSSNTPSRRGALLKKHRDNFTFTRTHAHARTHTHTRFENFCEATLVKLRTGSLNQNLKGKMTLFMAVHKL